MTDQEESSSANNQTGAPPRPREAPSGWVGGQRSDGQAAEFAYTLTFDPAEMDLLASVLKDAADRASSEAEQCQRGYAMESLRLASNAQEWRLRVLRDRLLAVV